MRRARRGVVALIAGVLAIVGLYATHDPRDASAQAPRPPPRIPTRPRPVPVGSAASPIDAGTAFRSHFGIELATTLLRSTEADERLRGIERAADLGGAEARVLLTQALASSSEPRTDGTFTGVARRDGRALVAATRGLARELLQEVRGSRDQRPTPAPAPGPTASLDGGSRDAPHTVALVGALAAVLDSPQTVTRDGIRPELQELARGIAARALALSGDPRALEALVKAARELEAGRPAAVSAMTALRARVAREGVVDLLAPPNLSPQVIALAGEVGDLRAVEMLQQSLRAADARTRAAAIVALSELSVPNVAASARVLLKDPDPNVRVAAGAALVKSGAPDAARVVEVLLGDATTQERAVSLAERVESDDVVRILVELARRPDDYAKRKRALGALARHRGDAAAYALASLIKDPVLRGDAVGALGRSPAPAARGPLAGLTHEPTTRRLGVRGMALRALVHGVDRDRALELARPLATTGDVTDRALYMFVNVALGAFSVEKGLVERDAPARAASVMGALGHLDERTCRALAARRAAEKDPSVQVLLALGFACERGADGMSSGELWARAREGGPDAPLSVLSLAARTHERDSGEVYEWLVSSSAILRSHVAAGLATAPREDAPGQLARVLLYEPDAAVRRAIVRALAHNGRNTPSGREALDVLTRWDPDDDVRALAEAVRAQAPLPELRAQREVAWLRLATFDGNPGGSQLAAVVRSDGLAVPILFDADGFAVVPGLPPGAVHLVLAPRLPRLQAP